MVSAMHDDSTPSREKDQSSRLNGDQDDSSGLVPSSSAVGKSEVGGDQKHGSLSRSGQVAKERTSNRNNVSISNPSIIPIISIYFQESNHNGESKAIGGGSQLPGAPGVSVSSRRSNKHLTYEEQILKSLRLVIKEEDLVKIRDNIIEGIKKY